MRTQNFQSGNKEKANQEKAWQWISIRRIPTNTKNAHTSIEDALIKNAPLQKRRTQKEPTRSCPTPQDGPAALRDAGGLDADVGRVSPADLRGHKAGAASRPRGTRARRAFLGDRVSVNTAPSDTFCFHSSHFGGLPHTRGEHARTFAAENNPHSLLRERARARRCGRGRR